MLTDEIVEAFRNSSYLNRFSLGVSEFSHDLILSGQLPSYYLKQVCQEIAMQVMREKGVTLNLRNEIKVFLKSDFTTRKRMIK